MSEIKLTLDLSNNSTSNDVAVELWLDENKFFDQPISQGTHKIGHVFAEDENQHQFRMVLKNKQHYHTKINEQGDILSDTLIDVKNICFDNINIDLMMYDHARYRHDTNGTGEITDYKFYGHLGCNGEVILEFYTPFYMWLLENM